MDAYSSSTQNPILLLQVWVFSHLGYRCCSCLVLVYDDECDIISNAIGPHICSLYVLHMEKEVTDQTRQQIFKTTYRRKIDLRRMTAMCQGDRELARSLVVSALREIADDIENGK